MNHNMFLLLGHMPFNLDTPKIYELSSIGPTQSSLHGIHLHHNPSTLHPSLKPQHPITDKSLINSSKSNQPKYYAEFFLCYVPTKNAEPPLHTRKELQLIQVCSSSNIQPICNTLSPKFSPQCDSFHRVCGDVGVGISGT